MRHLHSTKTQQTRKSTMKQTARAPNYAPRAVDPRIRNAGHNSAPESYNALVNTNDLPAMMVNRQRLKHRIMRHFEEQTGNPDWYQSTLMIGRILTEVQTRQKAEAQFWDKVNLPEHRSECWNWTAATRNGYGNLKVSQVGLKAHRLSYALHYSVLPANLLVCHHCDNPLCVNPHHLFLGTDADNTRDKVSKGRQSRRGQNGTRNGNAKINDEQLAEIRSRIAAGETNVSIAKDYPIGHAMVSRIRKGRSYNKA